MTSREISRGSDFEAVWSGAIRRILSFGVGMTNLSSDEPRIRAAIERGIEVHVVMVDPEWVVNSRDIAAIYDDFYAQEKFGERFLESHVGLSDIAREVNKRSGRGRLRIHTYRSVVTQSATIADPGTPSAFGQLELHTYGRYDDRIRTTLPGIDGQGLLLAQCLRSISGLAGYDFTNDNRRGELPGSLLSLT